jgi:hypothetical protein
MSTGLGSVSPRATPAALLSFEGLSVETIHRPASAELENCTELISKMG